MSALEDLLLRKYQGVDASSESRDAAPDSEHCQPADAAPCDRSLDECGASDTLVEQASENPNSDCVPGDLDSLSDAFTESVFGFRVFGAAWQDSVDMSEVEASFRQEISVPMGDLPDGIAGSMMSEVQNDRPSAFDRMGDESAASLQQPADSDDTHDTFDALSDAGTAPPKQVDQATVEMLSEVESLTDVEPEYVAESDAEHVAADDDASCRLFPTEPHAEECETDGMPKEAVAIGVAPMNEHQDETPCLKFAVANGEVSEQNAAQLQHVGTPFKPAWEVNRFVWPAICEHVEDAIEQQMVTVVEQLHDESGRRPSNVTVLSGIRRAAGSTTMTMCLVREAARQGLSVALVDLNHENPCLMDRLCVACEQGVEALPKSKVPVDEVCILAVEDGVSLVPMVEPLSPAECAGAEVAELMSVLSANHDLVLIDASTQVVEKLREQSPFPFGMVTVSDSTDEDRLDDVADSGQVWAFGVIKNFAA